MEAESKVESWEILQPTHLKSLIVSFRSGLKLDSWNVLRIIEKLGSFLRMRQQKNVIPRHSRCGAWDPSSLKVLNVQWWRPHVSNLSYNGDVTTWVKYSRTGIKQQWNNKKQTKSSHHVFITCCLSLFWPVSVASTAGCEIKWSDRAGVARCIQHLIQLLH